MQNAYMNIIFDFFPCDRVPVPTKVHSDGLAVPVDPAVRRFLAFNMALHKTEAFFMGGINTARAAFL